MALPQVPVTEQVWRERVRALQGGLRETAKERSISRRLGKQRPEFRQTPAGKLKFKRWGPEDRGPRKQTSLEKQAYAQMQAQRQDPRYASLYFPGRKAKGTTKYITGRMQTTAGGRRFGPTYTPTTRAPGFTHERGGKPFNPYAPISELAVGRAVGAGREKPEAGRTLSTGLGYRSSVASQYKRIAERKEREAGRPTGTTAGGGGRLRTMARAVGRYGPIAGGALGVTRAAMARDPIGAARAALQLGMVAQQQEGAPPSPKERMVRGLTQAVLGATAGPGGAPTVATGIYQLGRGGYEAWQARRQRQLQKLPGPAGKRRGGSYVASGAMGRPLGYAVTMR